MAAESRIYFICKLRMEWAARLLPLDKKGNIVSLRLNSNAFVNCKSLCTR